MEFTGFDKDFRLDGKVAVITGAAKGIGYAIAMLFAEKGADLVLVDMVSEETIAAAQAVVGLGRRCQKLILDIVEPNSASTIAQSALRQFSTIDILVNNAGVVLLDDAESLTEDYWDKTMAINLKAPFLIAQAVGREMIRNRQGKIINIASQAGMIALDKHVAYCSSKAAIIEMTKVLALEWGEFNINVNAISPTVVLTELGRKAWAGEVGEQFKKKIPIGRFAYPEEIAAAALYLASEAADMVTGSNLVIDGGFTAQ